MEDFAFLFNPVLMEESGIQQCLSACVHLALSGMIERVSDVLEVKYFRLMLDVCVLLEHSYLVLSVSQFLSTDAVLLLILYGTEVLVSAMKVIRS